ncbi:murein biosynthesis integral membrane protein MurJ [Sandaracinobacter sp. RS1-74]|uniref:murein biosynthesis integral membrane protein MurJ n=1 Tax=Sandaracinobacteroides sayramensis TaxID=2913411 RepID=UPI001EDA9DB3|nr:murein biosynthesis integral membrane protein MurJ [Sandaracinobacteroides sayramensis]MCG2841173.1 murein biosynthesis integral membrane protein MurJ [Sandaracinobacteroides sayramensis]
MSLIRAATTVGGMTLLSRIVGMVREILMARYLGAGFAADAFLVAFRLPNLFRSLFAEGAFSAAFVPLVSQQLGKEMDEADGRLRAVRLTEQALAVLFPVLLLFTIVIMLAASPIVWAMTGGFEDRSPEKLELTVQLTRLAFPYLMLISLASLLGGLLNALGRFWVYAAAPILLNLTFIIGFLLFRGTTPIETATMQAAAIAVAGILQFLWLCWDCWRIGVLPRLTWPRLTPEVKTLLKRIGPAAIGAGATQINLLVSTMIAARNLPEGSVSYLYYADRLNQLALGMIGVGMGVALLPTMGRLLGAGNNEAAIHQQNRGIEFVLLFGLPASVALIVSADPIVAALFQHGEFTRADRIACAAALKAFSTGLVAYMLVKVLTPGFHARGDTRTPMLIALGAIALNLTGNLLLSRMLDHVGIAVATSISAWVNVAVLALVLIRRADWHPDGGLTKSVPRMLAAALLMAGMLLALNPIVLPLAEGSLAGRAMGMLLLVGGGGLVYAGIGLLIGAWSPRQLLNSFRRG